jgi:general secretion pathway protein H
MRNKGFSLIELIVVLIVISLSISLVAPSLSRFSKTVELKGAAKKVSTILRYCRSEAVNKGHNYQVLFDSDIREVKVQSMVSEEEKRKDPVKTYAIPDGIQMKGVNLIEFYSNGGSNGGTILLDSKDHKGYKIKVQFLTGMVEIEKVEGLGR